MNLLSGRLLPSIGLSGKTHNKDIIHESFFNFNGYFVKFANRSPITINIYRKKRYLGVDNRFLSGIIPSNNQIISFDAAGKIHDRLLRTLWRTH